MLFFKKKNLNNDDIDRDEPVLAAVIPDLPFSEMYQNILTENGIPFVCRQRGAGGYIKLLTGGLLIADNIYVSNRNYEKARELYEAYIDTADSEDN